MASSAFSCAFASINRFAEILDKQKLIDALRSGQYRQTRYIVSDGQGGYCAIGAAAVLGVELTSDQKAFLQDLNNNIGLTFDEIARMLEVRKSAATPVPSETGIEARICELRALVANPRGTVA